MWKLQMRWNVLNKLCTYVKTANEMKCTWQISFFFKQVKNFANLSIWLISLHFDNIFSVNRLLYFYDSISLWFSITCWFKDVIKTQENVYKCQYKYINVICWCQASNWDANKHCCTLITYFRLIDFFTSMIALAYDFQG
jgi:hypothetical protein